MRFILIALICNILLYASDKYSDFPKLDSNYTWVDFNGIAIPKPKSWNELRTERGYFTSVESIEKDGIFKTGVTIKVFKEFQKKYGAPAEIGAISEIKKVDKDKDNKILLFKDNKQGDVKIFVLRYKNAPLSLEPIIVHKVYMVNNIESNLAIITFETPVSSWEKYWGKEGIYIFKRLARVD